MAETNEAAFPIKERRLFSIGEPRIGREAQALPPKSQAPLPLAPRFRPVQDARSPLRPV